MTTPRDFFEKILKPSYEAWVSDPLTEWKAKAAVSNADTMAERVLRYWKSRDASQIAGATDPSKYRTHLRENFCADFGLVWDIHDGHKHMVLSRANRQVTTSDQTGVRKMGYGQGSYGEGAYGGTDQIIVELASHRAGWRNEKHKYQWSATLNAYLYPVIGTLPVQTVDISLVRKVLEPIWTTKPETASRVRQRIEKILDFAKVCGYRDGENPARWRGHLDNVLPARSRVRVVEHHAALPYAELPAFLVSLRAREAIAARALEFLILTAARTGEAIGARWNEIDLLDKTWTVPAARMKSHREHRVPLSARALTILREMKAAQNGNDDNAFIFPGPNPRTPLSNVALLRLLERMQLDNLTVHGFRSSFRDWAAERTNSPNHVVEMALAHTVSDKVEAAYRRTDLFERRRRLMQQWATFCTSEPVQKSLSKVTPLRAS